MAVVSNIQMEVYVIKQYKGITDDKDEDDYTDLEDILQVGTTYTMNYTQTKNYVNTETSVQVKLMDMGKFIIDDYWEPIIGVIGCILQTEIPIYVAVPGALLSRPIKLLKDGLIIATGSMHELLDSTIVR